MNMNEYFDCIIKIIAEKKWNSPGIIPKCILNKAINLGKGFTDIERDFFIKMLEKFDIYPDPKYQDYLEEILNHINITEKKVYIAPLLSQVDKNNLYKSSHYIVRMFKSTYIKQLPLFDNKTVMLYQNDCIIDEDSLLILVDDFIGTGMTAHSCISYYESIGISKSKILVISFVIMETGLKKLNKENIKVEYLKKYNKCISGNYDRKIAQKLMNVNEAICLRNNIEKPLGFHNSQALIGMQRTPNNTLPIFWDNKILYPLFPRD